jgi:hypothetical protein
MNLEVEIEEKDLFMVLEYTSYGKEDLGLANYYPVTRDERLRMINSYDMDELMTTDLYETIIVVDRGGGDWDEPTHEEILILPLYEGIQLLIGKLDNELKILTEKKKSLKRMLEE